MADVQHRRHAAERVGAALAGHPALLGLMERCPYPGEKTLAVAGAFVPGQSLDLEHPTIHGSHVTEHLGLGSLVLVESGPPCRGAHELAP
jgi:hypothetical protein